MNTAFDDFQNPLAKAITEAFYPRIPQISLEVTSKCNLRCPYCANPVLNRQKGFIDWNLFEQIVSECSEDGLDLAWLHGTGEPLLWEQLESAISLIKDRGAGEGSFATNATLLTPRRSKSLLRAGLTSIYFSLDSLDHAVYEQTRGADLDKVVHNITGFLEAAPADIKVKIALMEHKDQHLTEKDDETFNKLFGKFSNVQLNKVVTGLMPNSPSDFRTDRGKTTGCVNPRNYLFISHEGIAALCCSDQHVAHQIGNVNEERIREIWYRPQNQEYFRNIYIGLAPCPELCWKYCHLKRPENNANDGIEPSLQNSVSDVLENIERFIQAGKHDLAYEALGHLRERDPLCPDIARLAEECSRTA